MVYRDLCSGWLGRSIICHLSTIEAINPFPFFRRLRFFPEASSMPSPFERRKNPRHCLRVSLILLPEEHPELLLLKSDHHEVEPEKEEKRHEGKECVVEHKPPAKQKHHYREVQRMPHMPMRTFYDQRLRS